MILDVVASKELLEKLHPGFGPALEYLRKTNLEELPAGRQEIDGERLYALVIRGKGQGLKGAKLEAHQRYIDVQYCVTGSDVIGWKHVANCQDAEQPYDEKKDCIFFRDTPDSWVTIPERSFGIFLPEDGHAPAGADGPIHKVVVKVAVHW
jgi:YhcH/YjgK/YiaL family protein